MKNLTIHLISPRGFCAGVRRAIDIVEKTLEKYGVPVFVRHEIVHNKHIIDGLKKKGVVFFENWEEIFDKSRPIVFSAHGVSEKVKNEAKKMNLITIDATCPLVEKVHLQMKKLEKENKEIIIIGKAGHVEIIGTAGQVNDATKIHILSNVNDIEKLNIENEKIGFVTQTTLSKMETQELIKYLKQRYPSLEEMKKDDICYATTNRQKALIEVAKFCDGVLIIGSKNSSNSLSLKKVAEKYCKAFLIDDETEIPYEEIKDVKHLGISAGASAPEYLVNNVLEDIKKHYDNVNIIDDTIIEENVSFKNWSI